MSKYIAAAVAALTVALSVGASVVGASVPGDASAVGGGNVCTTKVIMGWNGLHLVLAHASKWDTDDWVRTAGGWPKAPPADIADAGGLEEAELAMINPFAFALGLWPQDPLTGFYGYDWWASQGGWPPHCHTDAKYNVVCTKTISFEYWARRPQNCANTAPLATVEFQETVPWFGEPSYSCTVGGDWRYYLQTAHCGLEAAQVEGSSGTVRHLTVLWDVQVECKPGYECGVRSEPY